MGRRSRSSWSRTGSSATERELQRKVKELVLAYRLNDKYSKREILKQYLNTVYFGQGSYGVKATARRFLLTPDPSAPFGVRGKA